MLPFLRVLRCLTNIPLLYSVYERMWHNALLRLRDQLLIEDPTAGAIVPPHEDVPEVWNVCSLIDFCYLLTICASDSRNPS